MAGYVTFQHKGEYEYGVLCYSKWISSGPNGPWVDKERKSLGRVVDKERLIFRKRGEGLVMLDPVTLELTKPPQDYVPPALPRKQRKLRENAIARLLERNELILDFGDSFFLSQLMEQTGIQTSLNELAVANRDSLYALLCFYATCPESNNFAEDWLSANFAKVLYPKANLSSQRISELLMVLGAEENYRAFFNSYLASVSASGKDLTKVAIDSTGLPNSIKFPLTAISRHNGEYSEEVRMLYVVEQETGYPFFFRYFAGNVIDSTAVINTIAELKAYKLLPDFLLLDSGFATNKDFKLFYDNGIDLVTRLGRNRKIYKSIVSKHLSSLMATKNIVSYSSRVLFIKRVAATIEDDQTHDKFKGFAYLCLDGRRRRHDDDVLYDKFIAGDLTGDELVEKLDETGLFMLFSTKKIEPKDILPLYYTRQNIEQVFDICKNDAHVLPLAVRTEETLRGHLLLTFITTVLLKEMQTALLKTPYQPKLALMNLRSQKIKIFGDTGVTTEAVKKVNDVYKVFGIECPTTIDLTALHPQASS